MAAAAAQTWTVTGFITVFGPPSIVIIMSLRVFIVQRLHYVGAVINSSTAAGPVAYKKTYAATARTIVFRLETMLGAQFPVYTFISTGPREEL
jgi:hypothetical protein